MYFQLPSLKKKKKSEIEFEILDCNPFNWDTNPSNWFCITFRAIDGRSSRLWLHLFNFPHLLFYSLLSLLSNSLILWQPYSLSSYHPYPFPSFMGFTSDVSSASVPWYPKNCLSRQSQVTGSTLHWHGKSSLMFAWVNKWCIPQLPLPTWMIRSFRDFSIDLLNCIDQFCKPILNCCRPAWFFIPRSYYQVRGVIKLWWLLNSSEGNQTSNKLIYWRLLIT